MAIGDRVRAARLEAGLTQRDLAAKAGVPQSTVARIESGALDPRFGTLDRLLRVCNAELVVVERPGRGVDRTLIQARLAMTPRERVEYSAAASDAMAPIRGAARRRRAAS